MISTNICGNLGGLGWREINMLSDLLQTITDSYKCTEIFDNEFNLDEYTFDFNQYSGYVYLVDSDDKVAMLNDDKLLDIWLFTPYEGKEGFSSDMIRMCKNGEIKDKFDIEYLYSLGVLNDDDVKICLDKKLLTQEEINEILNIDNIDDDMEVE